MELWNIGTPIFLTIYPEFCLEKHVKRFKYLKLKADINNGAIYDTIVK